jgi:hypothetical protein
MRVDGLGNAGLARSGPARQENRLHGKRLVGQAARKQPLTGVFPTPIGSEQFQQCGRQQSLPVFATLAAAYPEHVAAAIDIAHLEMGDFRDSGSGGIHSGQQGAMV